MNKIAASYLLFFSVILFSSAIFLSSVVHFYHIQSRNEASINMAWLQIEKNYQHRASLISNLFTLIKNSKLHENNLLSELTIINNNIASLDTVPVLQKRLNRSQKQSFIEQYIEKQTTISQQLNSILAYDSFYAQRKSPPKLNLLLDEIRSIEDYINVNSLLYQEALEQYNIDLRRFPSSEIGRLQVLSEKIPFEQEENPNIETEARPAIVNTSNKVTIHIN